jgi:SAM-dependent methyltransferase
MAPVIQSRALDPGRLDELLRWGAEAWRDFLAGRGGVFHGFIPADHRGAYEALLARRGDAHSVLELGSGVGLITILADLLGFDAYGIELDPELFGISLDLAQRAGSGATFVEGSFVPPDWRDEISLLDPDFLTPTEGADAYDELGWDMSNFDLVYAYPWPGEEDWIEALVRAHAGPHTRLLTYSGTDGFAVQSFD